MDERFRAKPLVPPLAWFLIVSLSVVAGAFYYSTYSDLHSRYDRDVVNANASDVWRNATGKIKQTDVIKLPDPLGSPRAHIDRYQPVITYAYEIGGHSYQSNQISYPNPSFEQETKARDYANGFKVGDSVGLFYNPQSPGQSCLIKGITSSLKKTFFWRADESHNNE